MQQKHSAPAPLTWTLYGRRYDLAAFAASHPGGSLALLLGAGVEDCTHLFEAYHTRAPGVARALLASLAPLPAEGAPPPPPQDAPGTPRSAGSSASVSPLAADASPRPRAAGAPSAAPSPPSPASAFHEDLLAAVAALPGGAKMPASRAALMAALVAATAACWVAWAAGSTPALLALPLLSWLLTGNLAHDGGHFAVSATPLVNALAALLSAPLLYNTSVWYIQHNVLHHGHTNEVGADADLHHMAPFVRLHGADGWLPAHARQVPFVAAGAAAATLVQTLVFPLRLLAGGGLGQHVAAAAGGSAHIVAATRAGLWAQLAASAAVLVYPLWAWGATAGALAFALFPFAGAGLLFMLFTQVSHVQAEAQAGGGGEGGAFAHWSHQMVATSVDYSQDSPLMAFLSGGLNMQGLHHCLPSVCSAHYVRLYPTYRALAAKHGLRLREAPGLAAACAGYWRHLGRLAAAGGGGGGEGKAKGG
jgi:fatty acid desaturase